jgi:hypothetical protein
MPPSDQAHSASSVQALVSRHAHVGLCCVVVIHSTACEFFPSSGCRLRPVSEPSYGIAFRVVTSSKLHAWPAFRQHDYTGPHCPPARSVRLGLAAPKRRASPVFGVCSDHPAEIVVAPRGDTSGRAMTPFQVNARGAGCCDSQITPCILSILRS